MTPQDIEDLRRLCSTFEEPVLPYGTKPLVVQKYSNKCEQEKYLKTKMLHLIGQHEKLLNEVSQIILLAELSKTNTGSYVVTISEQLIESLKGRVL